ncbi:pilus assembly protein TadG-related protein [Halomonas beimenensis]|uniref:Putative Flp pilus-assembly TadG-like N-terminal domain-containing protein n=1 Tax=Halomonas beimenensis TaxID=475662 RepID=A0A291P8I3_9GAMM|nr:pilus assembly protein TadG-related protein [Halomonas beimenensis]ATJ83162.1 hypothetical protein BEI_2175 [Halomonas beimenensis]
MRRNGYRWSRRQAGAIGLLGAFVMLLTVLCIALALDTGRLYMEKRNLQRVADLAALEAMAQVSLPEADNLDALARAAASRNEFDADAADNTLEAELGSLRVENHRRVFVTGGVGLDNSLRVVASKEVPTSLVANLAALGGAEAPSTLTLSAEAVASRSGTAAFTVGTSLLKVDSDSSPLLAPLLRGVLAESHLDLSLIDHQGLLDTDITLLQLAEAMPLVGLEAVSSIDELLNADLSVSRFVELMAEVLQRRQEEGELAGIDLGLLSLIEESAGIGLRDITLGELLALEMPGGGRDEALETQLRLGDLLGVGLLVANGDNVIDLDVSSEALGEGIDELDSVLDLDIGLTIVEPPKLAIGPPGRLASPDGHRHWRTEVMSPQVALTVSTYLDLGLVSLDLGLRLDAGSGKAALAELGPGGEVEILAKPTLAALYLGDSGDLGDPFGMPPAPLSVNILDADDASLVDIRVSAEAVAARRGGLVIDEGDERLSYSPPYPHTQEVELEPGNSLGGLLSSLGNNLEVDVDLLSSGDGNCGLLELGCVIDDIVDTVVKGVLEPILQLLMNVLSPLVENIGTVVLGPLLELLGIRLDVLEVQVIDASSGRVELVK